MFLIKTFDKILTRDPTEPETEPTPKPATEATPTKHNKSKFKLQQEFMNEIIADEKDVNSKIFLNYLKYQNPSCLVNILTYAKRSKNEKIVNNNNNELIDLRNNINRNSYSCYIYIYIKVPENENPKERSQYC